MNYIFRQAGNTRSARVIYLDFTPNIVAAMQLPIGNIEWLDESTPATQPDPVALLEWVHKNWESGVTGKWWNATGDCKRLTSAELYALFLQQTTQG